MTWQTENKFHEVTVDVLTITAHFLSKYFGHDCQRADEMISEYFRKFQIPEVEDYVLHNLSWEMAKQIHFTIALGGNRGDITEWEMSHDLKDTPRDALAYMGKHFWDKHGI